MNVAEPKTLMDAVKFFSDLDLCHARLAAVKWPTGVVTCPKCAGENVGTIATRRMFKCRSCKKQFSVKVGTIFEDSPLGLDKWFVAVWSIANAKNGISSCELARALGVTQKSAWFMLHRVRLAMKAKSFDRMTGEVESDETFIGGKARNMSLSRRKARPEGTGFVGKAVVHGLIQRGDKVKGKASKVLAKVVPNTKKKSLLPIIRHHVEPGTYLYTDTAGAYCGLTEFIHETIDHAEAYVRGRCHTNGLENFWSLFKRAINGTYVSVDAQHLERYADEQVFRFNERKTDDAGRFALALQGAPGKRLTYAGLIGAGLPEGTLGNADGAADAPTAI